MANMEAGTVARIMVEEVVTRFGVPHVIHSDQGRQYESRLFQEMCETYALNIVSSVRLKRSTIPSDFGWYGVVLVLVVPSMGRETSTPFATKDTP
jgi:transposase InsO family protein